MGIYNDSVIVNAEVAKTLEYLQNEETVAYYDELLAMCIRAAIEDTEFFSEEETIDIVRGLHNLRQDLRHLVPSGVNAPLDPTGLPALPSFEERSRDKMKLEMEREKEESGSESGYSDPEPESKEQSWEE